MGGAGHRGGRASEPGLSRRPRGARGALRGGAGKDRPASPALFPIACPRAQGEGLGQGLQPLVPLIPKGWCESSPFAQLLAPKDPGGWLLSHSLAASLARPPGGPLLLGCCRLLLRFALPQFPGPLSPFRACLAKPAAAGTFMVGGSPSGLDLKWRGGGGPLRRVSPQVRPPSAQMPRIGCCRPGLCPAAPSEASPPALPVLCLAMFLQSGFGPLHASSSAKSQPAPRDCQLRVCMCGMRVCVCVFYFSNQCTSGASW